MFSLARLTPLSATVALATKGAVAMSSVGAGNAVSRRAMSSADASDRPAFDKILIANRGEIACRVIRTCQKLGIKTVAVHSDVDADALHCKLADEKFLLGPAPSGESYLRIDRIVEAIKMTGAQAVHPGYGFLSENKDFVGKLEEMGVAFIGPGSYAIEIMGDKIQSKICAENAGVNIIPGFSGVIDDEQHAIKVAREIGYPVMIKASAGGGGKGMRVAWNDDEVVEGYRLSSQEAQASFGDDRLLIEKFIDKPRHIEVQVLADKQGNTLYLNERECSIQRRNQKVIEEAPSTFLDDATRKAMGEQAVALAKAVNYESAGTVEFLVDAQRNFYFCEMNTRLQVEHPVTELIVGLDLVEQMINVAAGRPLNVTQDDIGIKCWALESRIYAEDSEKFLPSTGLVHKYIEPKGEGVRVDAGIYEGCEISMYYDPMISKLVTYADTREEALALMNQALDDYVIRGVKHNLPLLRAVYNHPRFISGDITTNFLPEEYADGFHGHVLTDAEKANLITAISMVFSETSWFKQRFVNVTPTHEMFTAFDLAVSINDEVSTVSVEESPNTMSLGCRINGDDQLYEMSDFDWNIGESVLKGTIGEDNFTLQVDSRGPGSYGVVYKGTQYDVVVRTAAEQKAFEIFPEKPKLNLHDVVLTPMPGTLISLSAAAGDKVAEGQEIAVVEAMKMQNQLRAPRAGVVKTVSFQIGDTLDDGDIIMEFEKEDADEE